MPPTATDDNEIPTSAALVRSLIVEQFPELADRSITPVVSAGTDNAMYRLGDDLAVRLPRIGSAVEMIGKEHVWLPQLGPRLSLSVPLPVAIGSPSDTFPFPWGIVEWLPGQPAAASVLSDPIQAAQSLGKFVTELHRIPTNGGPAHARGAPIRGSDDGVRQAIAALDRADGARSVDPVALLRAWEQVLDVPDWSGPPRWFHGDLGPLNLLAHEGRLTSVLDWGTCGVGDPAVDARVAWSLFDREARVVFRNASGFDEDAWERGRGWVLSGVTGVVRYGQSNPVLAATLAHGIHAVIDEG